MDTVSHLVFICVWHTFTYVQCVGHTICSRASPSLPHLCMATWYIRSMHARSISGNVHTPSYMCVRDCKLWAGEMYVRTYKRAGSHHHIPLYVHTLQLCVLGGMQYPRSRPHSCHPLHHEVRRCHLRSQLAGWREQEATKYKHSVAIGDMHAHLPYSMPFLTKW